MNGWWHIFKGNAVPSPLIEPLYVSIHINNPKELPQETIAHFKKHEPIGCRDYTTMRFLQGEGVAAYFSGCMTLTLGRTYAVSPEERTNTIYYVNFDKNIFVNYLKSKFTVLTSFFPQKVRRQLDNIIQTCVPDFTKCRHIYRDHCVPFSLSHDEYFRLADMYLRDYAKAKLVITSKIHCALPCAGMGVPVILIMNKPDDPRFDGSKNY
jgi:exopolysaccharide biosynthesis predicted pyruvyltransferase EpsI